MFLNWLKKKLTKEKPPKVLIWGVLDGPVRAEDVVGDNEEGTVGLILKISMNDEVKNVEFWFDTFDQAYEIVKHFHKSIEPLELNMKEFELVSE